MVNKIGISDFNIDISKIPPEIEAISNSLAKVRKTHLEKKYASAYDFLVILYHLRFEEKLEESEIAEKLHSRVVPIYNHLYNFSWHYSPNYEDNKSIFLKVLESKEDTLTDAKNNSIFINTDTSRKLKEAIVSAKNIREKSYTNLGFKSSEEYARVFYYLYIEKGLSARDIMALFGLTYGTAHLRLKNLGLNLSHEEGIKAKKNRKSQDYGESFRAGKRTRTKHHLSTSSKNEDRLRVRISEFIDDCLNDSKYEAIVGLNNTAILGSLEVDIPIVIYNRENNQIYRFAIEYNDEYYHSKERDANKKVLANQKGWHYLEVVESSSNQISNDLGLLDKKVREICEEIKNNVKAQAR